MPEILDTSKIIKGAAIFTIAFAWNVAAKDSINSLYPLPRDTVGRNILYASVVTIIALLIIWIYNLFSDKTNQFRGIRKKNNDITIKIIDGNGKKIVEKSVNAGG